MKKYLHPKFIGSIAMVIVLSCLLSFPGKAQDPVFSQPYLAPINLNPAATGCWRIRFAGERNLSPPMVDHPFADELYGIFSR